MPLPEGREPLTDRDMVVLLHNLARSFAEKGQLKSSKNLRETADRLSELSKKSEKN